MRTIFRCLTVAVVLLLCFACSQKSGEVRPKNVPADAVFVRGAKIGWWQQCIVTNGQPVHCRVWNQEGLVLEDEGFLPYDGGPPPTAEELKIASNPAFAGPDRIFLINNRVLLPQSRFDELKKFVDWLEGKSARPY